MKAVQFTFLQASQCCRRQDIRLRAIAICLTAQRCNLHLLYITCAVCATVKVPACEGEHCCLNVQSHSHRKSPHSSLDTCTVQIPQKSPGIFCSRFTA